MIQLEQICWSVIVGYSVQVSDFLHLSCILPADFMYNLQKLCVCLDSYSNLAVILQPAGIYMIVSQCDL